MTTAVDGAAGLLAAEPTDEQFADWERLAAEPASVVGEWADEAMSAAFREANRATWSLLRWIFEAAFASAGTTERVTTRRRAGKVPAASLGWSEGLGAARIELARQVLSRLPRLGQEMESGRLEEYKARLFTSTLADLDDEQARVVVDRLVEGAPGWSYQVLREKIESEAKAVDPGWAEARRAAAIARRRVLFGVEPSGAAALRGLDLPLEPAQDSHDRIVALAASVSDRLRALGAVQLPTRGQLEAEVLMVLTGPDAAGLWDDDVVELVAGRHTPGGPDDSGPDDPGPDDSGPHDDGRDGDDPKDDGPSDSGPNDDGRDGHCPDDVGPADSDLGGDGSDGSGPSDNGPSDGGPGGRGPQGGDPGDGSAVDSSAAADDPPTGPGEGSGGDAAEHREVPFLARPAIRVGLRTVLGFERRPGLIPGRASVCPSTARSLAWARVDAMWRLLLYRPDGELDHVLTLRPPRAGPPGAGGRRRRHIVELTAYTSEVDDLATLLEPDAEVPGGTAEVIPGHVFALIRRAVTALAAARAQPADEHPAVSAADEGRRMPRAPLRHWVLYRDLTCRGIGCDKPASVADVDHTHDHVLGGLSRADNLSAFCEGDHLFKHDPSTGWTVEQTAAGRFEWTAPTGRRHTLTPEPYDPGPDPVPPADGTAFTMPAEAFTGLPRPRPAFTPRRNRHGHITDAARDATEHLHERAAENPTPPDPTPEPDQDEEPPF